jgi:hypothetical protein
MIVVVANSDKTRQDAFIVLLFQVELVEELMMMIITYFVLIVFSTAVFHGFDKCAS